jgi:hypothetical protein
MKRILEHAVSATASGATPGQFPQIGGLSFSLRDVARLLARGGVGRRGQFGGAAARGRERADRVADAAILGRTSVYLEGRRGEVRTEETNLGDLSADANLWYC